jgi:hypothetical protein
LSQLSTSQKNIVLPVSVLSSNTEREEKGKRKEKYSVAVF